MQKFCEIYYRKFDEIIEKESKAEETKKNITDCFKVKLGKLEETIKNYYLKRNCNEGKAPKEVAPLFSEIIYIIKEILSNKFVLY